MTKTIDKLCAKMMQQDSKKKLDTKLEQTFYLLLDNDMKVMYDRINEQKSDIHFAKSAKSYMQGFRLGMQIAMDSVANRKENEDELCF
ncbi:hypothetical protein FZW75_01305 [Listeria monocytogenes]|uniref:hypothetical protein n=1 Tax=Listeria monocytogenes TaxID=1639 RepID=UPI0011EB654F|nr:hypothetical protein [Listeria monocytogenes]ECJ9721865.1 hypothetical protein [Listeria monocytogenes]TYU27860.1 hypothetical protein FZW75_01305 [Listeria monocytogenes]TYU28852.1 hypothetical protein FZW79_06585 [Listeria monocytogenes]